MEDNHKKNKKMEDDLKKKYKKPRQSQFFLKLE
jgi:hypothetical protein